MATAVKSKKAKKVLPFIFFLYRRQGELYRGIIS
jgi:hypothetical protein